MKGALVLMLVLFTTFALGQGVADAPIPQGVIKVRKPALRPYFKVDYYLTLARVSEVEILVPAANGLPGVMERTKVPVFDSSYSERNERVFPVKAVHLAKLLVDEINFSYSLEDSTSIDTMIVQMWIGKNGKIKWKSPDTTYTGSMPRALELELYTTFMNMTEWGSGGGYKEPKKFLRKRKLVAENYYCLLYITSAAKPITEQQKSTGSRYASFDIPLNSPPDNEQQKEFIDENRKKDQTKEDVN